MTSALGEVLAKRTVDAGGGVKELTTTLTVDVAVICKVNGWVFGAAEGMEEAKEGLGRARIWDRKFVSRKSACNWMTWTSQQKPLQMARMTHFPSR